MSKENDSNQLIKYCVHCGAKIVKKETYCPQCGKLVINLKPSEDIPREVKSYRRPVANRRGQISRKCSGCGSIITSSILDQCPICNSLLEPLPEMQKIEQSRGFVFTNKKFEPEQKFILKKDSWQLKEGISVFTNSIFVYITVQLFIIMFFWLQMSPDSQDQTTISEATIFLVLLSQIPTILLGFFPLWYIYTRKHNFEKLGFTSDRKKNLLALIIGILGGFGVITIGLLSSNISRFLYDIGLDFYDIEAYIELEYRIIQAAGYWNILLLIELIIAAISIEILFRGVLHNTLKEKFEDDNIGKISIILIVASVYSLLYLLFSFPIGIYFLIPNFLIFIFLGILYEINGNLYNTIIASVIYNIFVIVFILYF